MAGLMASFDMMADMRVNYINYTSRPDISFARVCNNIICYLIFFRYYLIISLLSYFLATILFSRNYLIIPLLCYFCGVLNEFHNIW